MHDHQDTVYGRPLLGRLPATTIGVLCLSSALILADTTAARVPPCPTDANGKLLTSVGWPECDALIECGGDCRNRVFRCSYDGEEGYWYTEYYQTQPCKPRSTPSRTLVKECEGGAVTINTLKANDLSGTFNDDSFDPDNTSVGTHAIHVPREATALIQKEEANARLTWDCGGKRSGEETASWKDILEWPDHGAPPTPKLEPTPDGKHMVASDAHKAGIAFKPGSDVREAAEKKGFSMRKCNWKYIESARFTSQAYTGQKVIGRCEWGLEFRARVSIIKGRPKYSATLKYSGEH